MKAAGRFTKLLLLLFAVWLLIPLQDLTGVIKLKPLYGDTKTPPPLANTANWFNASFQANIENVATQHFGLRPFFIRSRNQVVMSAFAESPNPEVIMGRERYLFDRQGLDQLHAVNPSQLSFIQQQRIRLETIHARLQEQDIEFLLVIAPSKAAHLPEFAPKSEWRHFSPNNYYAAFKKELDTASFPVLDFNAWFGELKTINPAPLFSKGGLHWSSFGAYLAADSILRFYDRDDSLRKYWAENYNLTDDVREEDQDLYRLMNVFVPGKPLPMVYPEIEYNSRPRGQRGLLVLGDSYYETIASLGIMDSLFRNQDSYWFYNNIVFRGHGQENPSVKSLSLKDELARKQLVIMLVHTTNLPLLPFDFDTDLEAVLGSVTQNP